MSSSSAFSLELVYGMLFRPSLLLGETHKKSLQWDLRTKTRYQIATSIWVYFIAIFTGFVLMFFFLYPEVYWYSGAIRSGPSLFMLQTVNPWFMIGLFLLGFIWVRGGYWLFNWLQYHIIKTTLKKVERSSDSTPKYFPDFHEYNALMAFAYTPVGIYLGVVVWFIFLFEKFNYAKTYFPIFDYTWLMIGLVLGLGFALIIKWQFEFKVNRQVFHDFNQSNNLILYFYPILFRITVYLII